MSNPLHEPEARSLFLLRVLFVGPARAASRQPSETPTGITAFPRERRRGCEYARPESVWRPSPGPACRISEQPASVAPLEPETSVPPAQPAWATASIPAARENICTQQRRLFQSRPHRPTSRRERHPERRLARASTPRCRIGPTFSDRRPECRSRSRPIACRPNRCRDAGPLIYSFPERPTPQAKYEDTGTRSLRNIEGRPYRINRADYRSFSTTFSPPI